eukprot:CAMPEP_0170170500 /NCGR_PEP_ID=MMETSP0040_2-20121228/3477_1 /TAXON_ID=641309 /ORGANISM="Lotharella oceanica, Strain CCMP622" /LENGTH=47 /DNA_ID= /DNA_START= /DNA_END= /DNA_ORIENTATION=
MVTITMMMHDVERCYRKREHPIDHPETHASTPAREKVKKQETQNIDE